MMCPFRRLPLTIRDNSVPPSGTHGSGPDVSCTGVAPHRREPTGPATLSERCTPRRSPGPCKGDRSPLANLLSTEPGHLVESPILPIREGPRSDYLHTSIPGPSAGTQALSVLPPRDGLHRSTRQSLSGALGQERPERRPERVRKDGRGDPIVLERNRFGGVDGELGNQTRLTCVDLGTRVNRIRAMQRRKE